MEEELVSTLFPDFTESEGYINPRSPFAYTRYFRESLPYLMAMGMSPDEFWDGDPDLALAYRQMWELKQESEFQLRNEYAWIHNMYTYATMLKVAPMFSSFADKNTHPGEYMDKPFDFFNEESTESEEESMERQRRTAQAKMQQWVTNFDQKFSDK